MSKCQQARANLVRRTGTADLTARICTHVSNKSRRGYGKPASFFGGAERTAGWGADRDLNVLTHYPAREVRGAPPLPFGGQAKRIFLCLAALNECRKLNQNPREPYQRKEEQT